MSYTCRVCGVITAALHHRCPQCAGIGTMRLDEEMSIVDFQSREREKAIQAMAQRIYEQACSGIIIRDFTTVNRAIELAEKFATQYYEAQDDTRGTASIKH